MLCVMPPITCRGTANGIAWGLNRLTGGILGIAFLPLYNLVGFDTLFIGFFFVSVAAAVHSAFFVPETKGDMPSCHGLTRYIFLLDSRDLH